MFTFIHHISLSVSDLNRSLAFYSGLGFEPEVVRWNVENEYFRKVIGYPNGVVHTALLRGHDQIRLELMQYVIPTGQVLDLATPNIGSTHMCFVVEDMTLAVDALNRRGVKLKSEPVEIDAGPNKNGFAVYFLDPDGYTMELLQVPKF